MGEFSSQNARLLDYLQTHEGITTAEAFDLFGITRLSARIWDLRDAKRNFDEGRNRIIDIPNQNKEETA